MNETIVIFGSSRKDGNTRKLMDWVANELEATVVDLASYDISAYDYAHENKNDDHIKLVEQIVSYKNLIIASPVYWYSVSAQMKVFIDRLSDLLDIDERKALGRKLRGKNVYTLCTSISEVVAPSYEEMIKNTFEYMGMKYGGCLHANCDGGFNAPLYEKDVMAFLQLIGSKEQ